MPAVTFDVLAYLIAGSGATSSDGQNNESNTLAASGYNGIMLIGGVLYSVISTSGHDLQVRKSTNDGLTWSNYGAAQTPTAIGGGMCVFAKGTDIWVGYTAPFVASSNIVYLRKFDTVGVAWGSEFTIDVNTFTGGDATIITPEGPYAGYVRPDGTICLLVEGQIGNPDVWALIFDAGVTDTFTAAIHFATTVGVGGNYQTSFMAINGDIHIFYRGGFGDSTHSYHQFMHASDNSLSTRSMLPTGLLNWNDIGTGWGFINGPTIYISVGKDTSESGIFGRAAIVYGNDAGWSTTLVLDTDVAMADFSIESSILVELGGYVIYVARMVSSDGTHYIIRAGYAAAGSFNNPSLWTWATLYDLAIPSPHVTTESGAYIPVTFAGFNSGLTLDSKGVLRYSTTLNGTEQFVTFLFTIIAAQVGNSFRCARVFSDPDA